MFDVIERFVLPLILAATAASSDEVLSEKIERNADEEEDKRNLIQEERKKITPVAKHREKGKPQPR